MSYSLDFRHKVLSTRKEEGLTIAEVAGWFKIGIASVTRWIKNPEPQRSRNKPSSKINMEALKQRYTGSTMLICMNELKS